MSIFDSSVFVNVYVLPRPNFIELPVPSHESALFELEVSTLPLPTIFLLDYGTVLTV